MHAINNYQGIPVFESQPDLFYISWALVFMLVLLSQAIVLFTAYFRQKFVLVTPERLARKSDLLRLGNLPALLLVA